MKMSVIFTTVVLAAALFIGLGIEKAMAEDAVAETAPAPLESEMDKVSYAIGQQFGSSIVQNGIEVNIKVLIKGMEDMLMKVEPALTPEEMQAAMMGLQTKMAAKAEEKKKEDQAASGENLEAANAFLAENGKKEGVISLPSGMQYIVVETGEGDSPAETAQVRVHYRGTLLDGTQFDSSYDRGEPATFGVNQVIKGWQEALQLMAPGGKLKLFIPPDLAYGENGRPSIPGNSLLVFDVELLEIL